MFLIGPAKKNDADSLGLWRVLRILEITQLLSFARNLSLLSEQQWWILFVSLGKWDLWEKVWLTV